MIRLAPVFFVLLFLGCAHTVPQELREKADKTVKTEALFKDPDAYKGKTVILGGAIIEAANAREGTYLEVLEMPLDSQGKPDPDDDRSAGRFIVFSERYLDPAIYSKGRLITAVGEVAGKTVRPIGQTEYGYVQIKGIEVYLHKQYQEPPVKFGIGIGVFHGY